MAPAATRGQPDFLGGNTILPISRKPLANRTLRTMKKTRLPAAEVFSFFYGDLLRKKNVRAFTYVPFRLVNLIPWYLSLLLRPRWRWTRRTLCGFEGGCFPCKIVTCTYCT